MATKYYKDFENKVRGSVAENGNICYQGTAISEESPTNLKGYSDTEEISDANYDVIDGIGDGVALHTAYATLFESSLNSTAEYKQINGWDGEGQGGWSSHPFTTTQKGLVTHLQIYAKKHYAAVNGDVSIRSGSPEGTIIASAQVPDSIGGWSHYTYECYTKGRVNGSYYITGRDFYTDTNYGWDWARGNQAANGWEKDLPQSGTWSYLMTFAPTYKVMQLSAFAFHLIEFDMTYRKTHPRFNLRVIGYASGSGGAGLTAKIWKPQTSSWELLGTNTATESSSEEEKTIKKHLVNVPQNYIDASNRIYILLRSTNLTAEDANAYLNSDYVELNPIPIGGAGVGSPLIL